MTRSTVSPALVIQHLRTANQALIVAGWALYESNDAGSRTVRRRAKSCHDAANTIAEWLSEMEGGAKP